MSEKKDKIHVTHAWERTFWEVEGWSGKKKIYEEWVDV